MQKERVIRMQPRTRSVEIHEVRIPTVLSPIGLALRGDKLHSLSGPACYWTGSSSSGAVILSQSMLLPS